MQYHLQSQLYDLLSKIHGTIGRTSAGTPCYRYGQRGWERRGSEPLDPVKQVDEAGFGPRWEKFEGVEGGGSSGDEVGEMHFQDLWGEVPGEVVQSINFSRKIIEPRDLRRLWNETYSAYILQVQWITLLRIVISKDERSAARTGYLFTPYEACIMRPQDNICHA